MNCTVILNAGRGSLKRGSLVQGGDAAQTIERGLASWGHRVTVEIVGPGGVELAVRRALDRGIETLISAGDNATTVQTINLLADTGVALGILPLSGIHPLAGALGIPAELPQALATLATAEPCAIDVGEVNGRVFVLRAELGLAPWLLHRAEVRAEPQALLRERVRQLRRELEHRPVVAGMLDYNGILRQVRTAHLSVRCDALLRAEAGQGPQGKLRLCIGPQETRRSSMRFAVRALVGKPRESAPLDGIDTRALTFVGREPALLLALDGELAYARSPLQFHIRARALRILRPLNADRGEAAS